MILAPTPAEVRIKLRETGYCPLPLIGKIPVFKDWPKRTDVTVHEIELWSRTSPSALNTGLLTRETPTLDLDITNAVAVAAIVELVKDRFEEYGPILTRVGRAPKLAIPFRTDQPFAKIKVELIAPDGSTGEKIEFLADGQQFVCFGVHPDTHRPYEWTGDAPGQIRREELPYLHEEQAHALVGEAGDLLCRDFGYRRADQAKTKTKKAVNGDEPADWATDYSDHDAVAATAMKMIKSGMRDGAVVNFLRAQVDGLTNIDPDRRARRLKEIPAMVASAHAKLDERPAIGVTPIGEEQLEPRPAIIKATPFVWVDPAAIPRRKWLYGRHYIRNFVSQTVAPGAFGKSSLVIVETMAIASGLPLLGVTPHESVPAWYWNGEDPEDELQRRIIAAALRHGVDRSKLENRLFVDTGRKTKIIVAEQTRFGAKIARPVVDAVIATIKANALGLMTVDPFVDCHSVSENDNPAIELVAGAWAEIADVTGCAIELVHHPRKTGGAEVTVEDGRGGSALLAKTRSARVLNRMTEDEAASAGVEAHRTYFRVTNDKENMSPPVETREWYRLESVDLGNGEPGDSVGVVTRWTWPNACDGVTVSDLRAVQASIAAGRWRESSQAKDWAGHAVAEVLDLDANNKTHRAKIASLLKTWIKNGMFVVVEGFDEKRERRAYIEVGERAND